MVSWASIRTSLESSSNVHAALGSVALLLVLLNLLTPALLGEVTSGGALLGEGELWVTLAPGGDLSFAVETLGNVGFSSVVVAINESAPANALHGNGTGLLWNRWWNASDVIASTFNVTYRGPLVVNVSALLAASGSASGSPSPSVAFGTFAFEEVSGSSGTELIAVPLYPLVGPLALPEGPTHVTWLLADLPDSLVLAQGPSTGGGT